MSARKLPPRTPRGPSSYVEERVGRVRWTDTGVLGVEVRGRTLRGTYGADLLARVAADPGAAPRPGDRVLVRRWVDDRVTVERVVARPVD